MLVIGIRSDGAIAFVRNGQARVYLSGDKATRSVGTVGDHVSGLTRGLDNDF